MIIGKLVRLLLKKGPSKVAKEVEEDLPSKLGKHEEDLEKYINDDNWCAQEKFDGRRRLILVGMQPNCF
jgi:hypothetical protein